MNRNNIFKLFLSGAIGFTLLGGFSSCGKMDKDSPGTEYMPDMYRSPSLETYNYIVTRMGDTILSARQPAAGSIARGYIPGLPPGMDYEKAAMLKNPLPDLDKNFSKYADEGKVIYGKFCIHCHGPKGAGDGKVGAKLPGPPPDYKGATVKELAEGKMFYSITNGKNNMGPHASQVTVEERWKLICYIQTLQGGRPSDTTAVAMPAAGGNKPAVK